MKQAWLFAAILTLLSATEAQNLLSPDVYRTIRANASGERPFADFRYLMQFSGFAPSAGANQIADYLLSSARSLGLSNAAIERFSSDGKQYVWAFRTEPYWEAHRAELWVEKPQRELLASFATHHVYLARLSRNASVSAELVDVNTGTRDEEYAGKTIAGKIVLATGPLSTVLRRAVWEHKALGIVIFRDMDATDYPDLVGFQEPKPWEGPHGEQTTFAFSLSKRVGDTLRERLAAGEHLVVHAEVEAEIGKGEYPEVRAEIPGQDQSLPAVLVYAHTNDRSAGGGNNLTGVGCTMEVARVLNGLIQSHQLAQPRRTIRFMWGPEHFGLISHFHAHPDDTKRILAMINVDMIGYDQLRTKAVAHLFRAPFSHPTFLDDVVQSFMEDMGANNTISIRYANLLGARPSEGFLDPTFSPLGSRSDYRYGIERFWGPSDHEDAGEASIGIPAILLGDFPDVFLGTQQDTPEVGDPTQMRRGVIVAAASAYAIASAKLSDLPAYLDNAVAKAKARLAEQEHRAHSLLRNSDSSQAQRDARTLLHLDYVREAQALYALTELVGAPGNQLELVKVLTTLQEEEKLASERLQGGPPTETTSPHPVEGELIPERNTEVRGPVNFYRPEYGRWWLTEKTGDEHFDSKIPLARRGHYVMYEALNFVDGKRNIAEIRDLVSDEFEPIPVDEFTNYFEFLATVGVLRIKAGALPH
jgi:aminopeptidase YwaD